MLKNVLDGINILLHLPTLMPDGVTGNTSVFGTEESRFEP
jgi:hypothetical protein